MKVNFSTALPTLAIISILNFSHSYGWVSLFGIDFHLPNG
jgi:hypothetical protein